MRLRSLIDAFLWGAAVVCGATAVQELRDPYSDARLALAGVVDRLREVTR